MKDKLKEDLKQAQLKRDEVKVSTLRLLISEINNLKIQKQTELTDQNIISVIQKELKKRTEAALGFRSGQREDSAQKEEAEAKVLEEYLPKQLSNEELTKIVEGTLSEASLLHSQNVNDVEAKKDLQIGKIIGIVMSKVGNRADGARVSSLVKEKLLNG